MAILKCKMCGGDLEIQEGLTICECEYCGTKQTIPALDNEKKLNLFNRANRLRLNSEFDKAASIYENIIAEFPEEAEGYWGLVLCNYGIEYVDDPATAKKIPTCHRAAFESVTKDENYELALEYADVVSQKVYRDEAREIDRIMSEILSISKNEEPYDIFICYKETDDIGGRTIDSVIAQDVYDALTDKGYRVFFSRISLEDKLGKQYEPYIFAALNSAKVMLAFGTKYEYFHAVWVKNEWSRFLKLMAKDKSKSLVPCYKDMNAYDMPDEFKALQAQDMGKVGAIQDLVRGIEKLLPKSEPVSEVKETVVVNTATSATIDSLLKRAFIFIEDEEWSRADDLCEQVLNVDPECAQAYLGKLMVELRVINKAVLKNVANPFDDRNNYQKVMRYGDEGLKKELSDCTEYIKNRNETTRKDDILLEAKSKMVGENISAYEEAVKFLESIPGWRDADEQRHACKKRIEEIKEKIEEERIEKEKLKKKKKKRTNGIFGSIVAIVLVAVLMVVVIIPKIKFSDIVDVSAGTKHTLSLKSNGSVVAAGSNKHGQCNVSNWSDIIKVSAGGVHSVGLRRDGTVVAVGSNAYGRCNVSKWTDIIAVSARISHTVGLKSDGTVVAVGDNAYGQCDVKSWTDIVAISAGYNHTVGLKSDGTVVAVGDNNWGQCNVTDWADIVAIAAGEDSTVCLKSDGTVVAVGNNEYGQCNVEDWEDIVAISAGLSYTVGLKSDGTAIATGFNGVGQCNVFNWNDIASIDAGHYHTVGLKLDGTVDAVGYIWEGQCLVG